MSPVDMINVRGLFINHFAISSNRNPINIAFSHAQVHHVVRFFSLLHLCFFLPFFFVEASESHNERRERNFHFFQPSLPTRHACFHAATTTTTTQARPTCIVLFFMMKNMKKVSIFRLRWLLKLRAGARKCFSHRVFIFGEGESFKKRANSEGAKAKFICHPPSRNERRKWKAITTSCRHISFPLLHNPFSYT